MENLGDYKKIYPFSHSEDDPTVSVEQKVKWQLYESILSEARDIFVKQTGVGSGIQSK